MRGVQNTPQGEKMDFPGITQAKILAFEYIKLSETIITIDCDGILTEFRFDELLQKVKETELKGIKDCETYMGMNNFT